MRAAKKVFGENVRVRLFGSRVDDSRRGGDIDLHIDVDAERCNLKNEMVFELVLKKTMGERKIDVVLHKRDAALRPIDEIAITSGIEL